MADENIPKQYFHLRDIPTQTVTLYPARAHIVRELRNIALVPGQNEVEVYGFATTIDEHSLQIEGTGNASVTITDITIDQVPNKEKFEDVHDEYEEDISEVEDYEDSDDDAETVKRARSWYDDVQRRLDAVQDEESSANTQLDTLNNYLGSVKAVHSDAKNFAESVRTYSEERKRIAAILAKASKAKIDLGRERDRALWQLTKAQKAEEIKNREATKAKEKVRQQKLRQQQERRNEINRKNDELRKFFPDRVYRVVVRLETAVETPSSSRRSSLVLAHNEASEKALSNTNTGSITVGLSISYVTGGSYWVPRYDLNISSIQKTALITYRAEVRNGTSETWNDAKVILSTSQTSYSGLEDKVPIMQAWQVTLNRYARDDALMSNAEISHLESRKNIAIQSQFHARAPQKKRKEISAKSATLNQTMFGGSMAPRMVQETEESEQSYGTVPAPPSGDIHRSIAPAQMPVANQQFAAPVLSARASRRGGLLGTLRRDSRRDSSTGPAAAASFDEVATLNEPVEETPLTFEESAWEDHGLTAAYELPGSRTLAPSSLGRRHKIAVLSATGVILNHIAVPKLKAAAFLRAKIKNPSASVTLLKGQAGITLDGSFLGNIPLQRVSPNQIFSIPLGVDPAIQISYPKPTLHRSTQGIFNKERAHVFSRYILISNTKTVPIDLLVLDQVPLSQDERLRIDISQPRGLVKEGDAVRCGQPVNDAKKPWGKATATLKKDGEVAWTAEIEKGQACMLKFEYEAKMPSTESMANA